jgi:hypothetical protein
MYRLDLLGVSVYSSGSKIVGFSRFRAYGSEIKVNMSSFTFYQGFRVYGYGLRI